MRYSRSGDRVGLVSTYGDMHNQEKGEGEKEEEEEGEGEEVGGVVVLIKEY